MSNESGPVRVSEAGSVTPWPDPSGRTDDSVVPNHCEWFPMDRDEPSRLRQVGCEHDGIEMRLITFEADDARQFRKIVDVVGRLLRRHAPLVEIVEGARRKVQRKTPLCEELLRALRGGAVDVARRLGDQHRLHPYFTAFHDLVLQYPHIPYFHEELPDVLKQFVKDLRERCSTPEVCSRLDNAKRVARNNTRSALQLLDGARTHYSKVLALRFDLEYLVELAPMPRARPLAEEVMKSHRKAFIKLLREGPYAKHLVGYVVKTEWGLQRGWHHHVLVLFNGQAVCADIRIADALCSRWKYDITAGSGAFENCNKRKELYRYCGIGMLSRHDDSKWKYLADATAYVTKSEIYAKSLLLKSSQCFTTGGPYLCTPSAAIKRKRISKAPTTPSDQSADYAGISFDLSK